MATVQANPAMQAGPAGLPPNLTPQQVQETYQVRQAPLFTGYRFEYFW